MNAEYQRLEAEASDVMRELQSLSAAGTLQSSVEVSKCESQAGELGRRLASLHLGMKLIRSVESPEMAQAEREFVNALPKKFHSQGTRSSRAVSGVAVVGNFGGIHAVGESADDEGGGAVGFV